MGCVCCVVSAPSRAGLPCLNRGEAISIKSSDRWFLRKGSTGGVAVSLWVLSVRSRAYNRLLLGTSPLLSSPFDSYLKAHGSPLRILAVQEKSMSPPPPMAANQEVLWYGSTSFAVRRGIRPERLMLAKHLMFLLPQWICCCRLSCSCVVLVGGTLTTSSTVISNLAFCNTACLFSYANSISTFRVAFSTRVWRRHRVLQPRRMHAAGRESVSVSVVVGIRVPLLAVCPSP